MKRQGLILIGGGGHCKACIDVIEAENRFRIVGVVDVKGKVGRKVLDYEIIGYDDDLPTLAESYGNFLVTIGQIKSPAVRISRFEFLKRVGAKLPVIISPNAYVSKHAVIGEGTIIMHRAVINAGARVGRNCIINTGAIIEHDAIIGDHCHVSTSAVINGGVRVGDRTFFGSNAVAKEAIEIGEDCIVGAGVSVMKSLKSGSLSKNR
ncbi:MAG: acetyltransferase [Nitrospirae bacterium]|nr:MAG: acetyltransferase [Nitrospirota bacterium]